MRHKEMQWQKKRKKNLYSIDHCKEVRLPVLLTNPSASIHDDKERITSQNKWRIAAEMDLLKTAS